jgi:arylsulfatase A-like enzyme
VPAGRVDAESVLSAFDLAPTLCALAGARVPRGGLRQGEDARAALRGEAFERKRPLLWRRPAEASGGAALAIRKREYKLILDPAARAVRLYRVTDDPDERRDLARELPGVVEYLSTTLLAWDHAQARER